MPSLLIITIFSLAVSAFAKHAPPPTDLTYETFRSPPVPLRSGQIANTNKFNTPMPFVKGAVAVRYFSSRITDDNGDDVPMADLYAHHWLMFNETGHNGGLCANLDNIWGIGAELENVVYSYPKPYAVVTNGQEKWSANLHFIRTTNMDPSAVQDCIECRCADSEPPLHPHGTVNCCVDGSQCYGMENSTLMDTKNFYLEYTVGYEAITPATVPLTIFSFDVTASRGDDCRIQYDVPALADGEIDVRTSDSVVPGDMNVTFLEVHQHIGGLNMSVEHIRNGASLGVICVGVPVYEESGENKGHLIDIPTCVWPANGLYPLLKGDMLRLTSVYGPRTLPSGTSWHAGVMGLVFMAAVATPDPKQTCIQSLHALCGTPVYPSLKYCTECALEHYNALEQAGCTKDWVQTECSKNNDNGNIPAPDTVNNMTLKIHPKSSTEFAVEVTCPADAWCGVAIATKASMEGADAYIYSSPLAKVWAGPTAAVHRRTLGNHASGTVVNKAYPATITSTDGMVALSFNISYTPPASADGKFGDSSTCLLFAQGSSGALDFAYHGSTRGFTCL